MPAHSVGRRERSDFRRNPPVERVGFHSATKLMPLEFWHSPGGNHHPDRVARVRRNSLRSLRPTQMFFVTELDIH